MAQKMYSEIQLDLEIKGYIAALEKAKQANAKLKADYQKKIDGMNKKSGDLMATFKKMAGVIGVAFGTQQIIAFTREAMMLAAKAEGVKAAFDKLNSPDLLSNLREATRNTVDDVKLMTAAVQANNFKISLEQLPKYFEFAQQRSRATGESVDYLVDSIVRGIGRKSALVLDNLGISLSELNKQLELTPDYATAVGAIIEREMAKSGEYVETTADAVDQLKTAMTNLKTEAGDVLNDVFAKPLTEAAKSLTDFVQGIQMLRAELELGGANKDLANQVRGNISMASGTGSGYLMSALFGGRKAGKNEILIPSAAPIVKNETLIPSAAPNDKLEEIKKAVDEVDESVRRVMLDAVQMWKTLINPTAKPELGVASTSTINMFGNNQTLYGDPSKLAEVQGAMVKVQESLENQYQVAGMLQNAFGSMFSAGVNGWDDFGQAAVNAIKQMLVQLATLAATYAVLSMIPGFAGFMEAVGGFSGFMRQGMGFTAGAVNSSSGSIAGGGTMLKGRDIAIASSRSGNIIYKNT